MKTKRVLLCDSVPQERYDRRFLSIVDEKMMKKMIMAKLIVDGLPAVVALWRGKWLIGVPVGRWPQRPGGFKFQDFSLKRGILSGAGSPQSDVRRRTPRWDFEDEGEDKYGQTGPILLAFVVNP